jgi:hypothetical protein
MILSLEALTNFIDLISDGVSVSEASVAIGAAPHSKIAFKWISDSAAAMGDDPRPDPLSPWCIVRDETPQWFHEAYKQAVIAGRVARSIRRTPVRADLEARLRAKKLEQPKQPGYVPPRVMIGKPSDEPTDPVARDLPPPPKPRPSYALRAKPLDGAQRGEGPPQEGRFLMVADKPKSLQERRAGKPEITELGVRRW